MTTKTTPSILHLAPPLHATDACAAVREFVPLHPGNDQVLIEQSVIAPVAALTPKSADNFSQTLASPDPFEEPWHKARFRPAFVERR